MTAVIYSRAERCLACHACEVACEREHGASNVTVVGVEDRFAAPLMCRHCDPAPCVAACYTGALNVAGGLVTLTADLCTGCDLCVLACPLGALGRTGNSRAVHHCNLCAERRAAGREPACALTCPAGALTYEEHHEFVGRVQHRAAAELVHAQQVVIRR